MSTTQVTPTVRKISSALSAEIREIGYDQRGFSGASIVSCFKNVVCLELRMSLLDLPEELLAVYDDATSHQAYTYDPAQLAEKIDKIGDGQ